MRRTSRYTRINGDALDQVVARFLNIESKKGPQAWLIVARTSMQLSTGAVARRMDRSRSSYAALEKREASETVKLQVLQNAASAMDCEFIYVLKPKETADCR